MAHLMKIHKGLLTYKVFEKSIQVCGADTAQMIFFGRQPGENDVDALHNLTKMGAKIYADLVRDVLSDAP